MLSLLPQIRAHFPALAGSTVFLDNAGGSQLPRCVIDAVRRYMEHSFVQLGGDYPLSQHASRFIPRAPRSRQGLPQRPRRTQRR